MFSKLPRYLQAVVLLMLLSAVLHIAALIVYFFMTGDSLPLNFFSVVGLNLFFPSLVTSPFAGIYSSVATLTLYFLLFFFFTHENRRSR